MRTTEFTNKQCLEFFNKQIEEKIFELQKEQKELEAEIKKSKIDKKKR